MEAAHAAGLEAPAKGTLELPVGAISTVAAAQLLLRVSAVHSMVVVSLLLTLLFLFLTLLLDFPHTAVGVELSSHCCWS